MEADMERNQRRGVPITPCKRLTSADIEGIHQASIQILHDPGILCFNEEASQLFGEAGAKVEHRKDERHWHLRIGEKLVQKALETVPSKITLGAREPGNVLHLDALEPRARFVSGSETNVWLEMKPELFVKANDSSVREILPVFTRRRGMVSDLCDAAHLCEHLENLDAFIRTVNIQDDDITEENKDVNKFFASLNNTARHVMGGLTDLRQLKNVILIGEIIVGGREELRRNPVLSFITCITKSPLQFVSDSTQKFLEIIREEIPVVISSSPQGGSTAPIQEAGMVSQINAEILAGVVLSQLAKEGAPVLYGSVPVRSRMDDLHDMYGAPEFIHYNMDCVQMARHYRIPCYSTAGVGDTGVPGIQATVEKLLSHLMMMQSGAQYIHYAFGLLERTNTFSMEQAVLDNEHLGIIKKIFSEPRVSQEDIADSLSIIKKVMDSPHRLYARYSRRLAHSGEIYGGYPFESRSGKDEVLLKAHERVNEIMSLPRKHLSGEITDRIFKQVPGLLRRLNPYSMEVRI
jgi:trimethylamine--corrinoid protein Co-methyltransferase